MKACRNDGDCVATFVKDNLCHLVPQEYKHDMEQDDGTDYFRLIEEKDFEAEAMMQKGDFLCLKGLKDLKGSDSCGFPYIYIGEKLYACRDDCTEYR